MCHSGARRNPGILAATGPGRRRDDDKNNWPFYALTLYKGNPHCVSVSRALSADLRLSGDRCLWCGDTCGNG